jgi:catechol 2,3-dioxygenase-like lactoylglutathione lyase family enzyme
MKGAPQHVTNLTIGVVTISVKDQEAAKAFYVGKLGMEVRIDLPMDEQSRWLEVAPPGSQTSLVLYYDPENAGRRANVVLRTTDIHALHAELVEKGVTFTEDPNQQDWGGIQAQFIDQDDTTFVLTQIPTGNWQ